MASLACFGAGPVLLGATFSYLIYQFHLGLYYSLLIGL